MFKVTKAFEFDAAHRLPDHKGKCCQIHGHRYRVEVTFSAPDLNDEGMVIDFGDISTKFKAYLNSTWDHVLILDKDDELGLFLWSHKDELKKESTKKIMMTTMNSQPTAEAMAYRFFEWFETNFRKKVEKVRVYETPNSWADYVPC